MTISSLTVKNPKVVVEHIDYYPVVLLAKIVFVSFFFLRTRIVFIEEGIILFLVVVHELNLL